MTEEIQAKDSYQRSVEAIEEVGWVRVVKTNKGKSFKRMRISVGEEGG